MERNRKNLIFLIFGLKFRVRWSKMRKTWAYVILLVGLLFMFINAYEAWNYHNISKFELNSSNEMIDQRKEIDNPELKEYITPLYAIRRNNMSISLLVARRIRPPIGKV